MTQHIPETADEIAPIPDWMTQETTMTEQQRLNSDLDDAANFGRGVKFALLFAFLIAVGIWSATTDAQTARTATITFTAPTTRTDGTNIAGTLSYEVWQGLKGGTKGLAGTINNTSTTITTGLQGGREYCWYVIAVEAGNPSKSAPSNESCKAFDLSGPNVVTITVN